MRGFLLLSLVLLGGCDVIGQPAGLISHYTTAYREVISESDRARLRDWRKTFETAIELARKGGHSTELSSEGVLLDPDAALGTPAIPNGMYRCKVVKLGAKEPGNLDFVVYGPFTCRVRQERALQRLGKLSGAQRYVGLIFPGDPLRNIFLGTVVFADETRALQYGQDELRDVAGYVERIAPDRWRLVMPQPHYESRLDVMELVPEGAMR